MVNRSKRWLVKAATVGAAVTTAFVGVGSAGASAAEQTGPEVLAEGLAGPLQIAVGDRGEVLVGQAFGGVLSRVGRDGTVEDLHAAPGAEIAGVAPGPFGTTYFTEWPEGGNSRLRVRTPDGKVRTVVDLTAYEQRRNPDAGRSYGVEGLSPACEAEWPVDEIGPPSYTGVADAHPYALATTLFGIVVADAAANDILLVDWSGRVSVLAVLPSQPTLITAEAAAASGIPECAVGSTYHFEAVPTDVEVGPGGNLYVTTLPGGPEDPSLGARGSVYRINPFTRQTSQVATGFAAPTNLALSPGGSIYVAELFGGQVSKVVDGAPVPVAAVDSPGALEWHRGRLLVTAGVFGPGQLLSLPV